MERRAYVARSVACASGICRRSAITTKRRIEPGSSVTYAVRNSTRNRTCAGTWQRHTALEKPRSLNVRFATGDSRRSSTCDVTWRKRTRSTNLCSMCTRLVHDVTWRKRTRWTNLCTYSLCSNYALKLRQRRRQWRRWCRRRRFNWVYAWLMTGQSVLCL